MILSRLVGHTLGALGDLLLPPACAVCGALLDDPTDVVCPKCWVGFEPLRGPLCERCGQPYPGAGPCPDCRGENTRLDAVRSAYAFGGTLQEAVLRLKLSSKNRLADLFAELIMNADLPGLDPRAQDLLVPVPLHHSRQASRGYNQSQMIARRLSRRLGVPSAPFHLQRIRPTPSQNRMKTRAQREENVKGAFSVEGRHPFGGRRLCLVDDVVTTGSTLRACAAALHRAGAKSVVAITLARTVHR